MSILNDLLNGRLGHPKPKIIIAAAPNAPQQEKVVLQPVDRTREIATLEECDLKLEALQDYQRGDCKVLPIRQLIDQRIKACHAEQKRPI